MGAATSYIAPVPTNDPVEPLPSYLPSPTGKRHPLRVTPPAERSLRDGHPWLFDTSILEGPDAPEPGDLGIVFDRKKRFLAVGLIDPASPIRLRVLHHGSPCRIDADWFAQRIAESSARRDPLRAPGAKTDGFRLVNGESDGLPGLVVDRYARTLVIKLYSAAWIPYLRGILQALATAQPHERLVLRMNRSMRKDPIPLHGLSDGQILVGSPLDGPVLFQEHGLVFEAEPVTGQKTGFFLDQRENRRKVGGLAKGRHVLNVFSYTGGFTVHAAAGGARSVTSIDLSKPAIEAVERNLDLNRHLASVARCPHRGLAVDAFQALETMAQEGRRFGLVILDPPMFAQSAAQAPPALRAYARLTRLGLSVLQPGGTLVQASCSNRVDAQAFFDCVIDAAAQAGRPLENIETTDHAMDHPIGFADGQYLKCLFAIA